MNRTILTSFLNLNRFAPVLMIFLLLSKGPAYAQSAPSSSEAPNLDFLIGTWFIAEMNVHENWEKDGAGYKGRAYSKLSDGSEKPFETFKVHLDKGIWHYTTDVIGQGVTSFALVEKGNKLAVFSNPANDFPSSITYFMEEGVRKVRLVGSEGEQMHDMVFELKDQSSPAAGSAGGSAAGGSALGSYCQVSIGTNNLLENSAFYQKLGFKVVSQDNDPWPWILLSDGSIHVQLSVDGMEYFGINYYNKDLPTTAAMLKDKGVEFFMESSSPWPLKVMEDPDGRFGIALIGFAASYPSIPPMTKGSLGTLGEIAIPVTNFDTTSLWLQQLGFTSQGKQSSPYTWGIHTDGLISIGLHQSDHFDKPAITYFSPDSQELIKRLKAAGMEVENAMPGSAGEIQHGVIYSPDGWPVNIFNGSL